MTPTVDINSLSPLTEIILRAGDVGTPNAKIALQTNYTGLNPAYPDVVGISVAFRVSANLDDLARANHYPHGMLSWSVLLRVEEELTLAGFGMVLYITPDPPNFPDHHSLAVTQNDQLLQTLPEAAADALILAFKGSAVRNPYQQKKSKP